MQGENVAATPQVRDREPVSKPVGVRFVDLGFGAERADEVP